MRERLGEPTLDRGQACLVLLPSGLTAALPVGRTSTVSLSAPGVGGARSGHGRQQLGQADQSRRRCWLKPLRTALDRRGNPFLELTPALRAHVADSEPLFFEIDGHPNAEGYRLIARLVADLLMGDSPRTGMVNRGGGGA